MKPVPGLAAAVAAALLLAGCGGGSTETRPTFATPTVSMPSIDEMLETAPPPGPSSDGYFMAVLQRQGAIDPELGRMMIPLARTTCDMLKAGTATREQIIRSGETQGLTQSRLITDTAIKTYCPEVG